MSTFTAKNNRFPLLAALAALFIWVVGANEQDCPFDAP
jgi:hypothetical protein